MYLLYADESGHPTSWTEYSNYVLGGVAVHEGQVIRLARAFDEIQRRYYPDIPHALELHAQHIGRGKGRWRKESKLIRQRLMQDVYDLIANAHWPGLVAFAVVVDVSYGGPRGQAYANAFEQLCATFDFFLVRQYTDHNNPQKGLLIFDTSPHEARLRELLAELHQSGTYFGREIYNVLDAPLFINSAATRLIQVADFCSYAVFRHYERGESEHFEHIFHRFDRDLHGTLQGLRHLISSKKECTCPAYHVRA